MYVHECCTQYFFQVCTSSILEVFHHTSSSCTVYCMALCNSYLIPLSLPQTHTLAVGHLLGSKRERYALSTSVLPHCGARSYGLYVCCSYTWLACVVRPMNENCPHNQRRWQAVKCRTKTAPFYIKTSISGEDITRPAQRNSCNWSTAVSVSTHGARERERPFITTAANLFTAHAGPLVHWRKGFWRSEREPLSVSVPHGANLPAVRQTHT